MNEEERAKKSFDITVEYTKQLISLSTAIIAAYSVLAKDIIGSPNRQRGWLLGASALLLISISFGVLNLGNIAGNLGSDKVTDLTIYRPSIRALSAVQVSTFLIAVVLIVVSSFLAV